MPGKVTSLNFRSHRPGAPLHVLSEPRAGCERPGGDR